MDFYKPELCYTISMEENNRHDIIYNLYNVSDNINQTLLWNISCNGILNFKFYPSTPISKYYNLFYPYYCQKLNVQD